MFVKSSMLLLFVGLCTSAVGGRKAAVIRRRPGQLQTIFRMPDLDYGEVLVRDGEKVGSKVGY